MWLSPPFWLVLSTNTTSTSQHSDADLVILFDINQGLALGAYLPRECGISPDLKDEKSFGQKAVGNYLRRLAEPAPFPSPAGRAR